MSVDGVQWVPYIVLQLDMGSWQATSIVVQCVIKPNSASIKVIVSTVGPVSAHYSSMI